MIVPSHLDRWYHLIHRPMKYLIQQENELIPDTPIELEKCVTYRGEIMCPCGRYILQWDNE